MKEEMKFLSIVFFLVATIGICSCYKNSECEILMAKLFASRPYEFVSGGCIDAKHAYLHRPYSLSSSLMFVSIVKDTFVTDSVIDFSNSFANDTSEEKSLSDMRIDGLLDIANDYLSNSSSSYSQYLKAEKHQYRPRRNYYPWTKSPVIYRKKDIYQFVSDFGVYEISFEKKELVKILEFRQTDQIKEPILEEKNEKFSKSDIEENRKIKDIIKDITERLGYIPKLNSFRCFDCVEKVYFTPEYTKITFKNSYLTLYENGEITANVEPGYCLYAKKLDPEEKIIGFGLNCIVKEN